MSAAIRQQWDSSPRNHLEKVLENELDLLQQRVLETAKGQFLFHVTVSAREFLLLKGTEQRFGAQRLKLAIERHVVYPLANHFATDQIHVGDIVRIDRNHNQPRLNFTREVKNLAIPARRLEPEALCRIPSYEHWEVCRGAFRVNVSAERSSRVNTAMSFRMIRAQYFVNLIEDPFARYANSAMPERDPCWRVRCRAFACGSRAWTA